ncbi:hypothetical protein U9M48_018723 [Paspalum notatum var. saurae]|uniref:Uncharacterized protein n=1 Tax=Paspalum notatum var. saurae TaxID=547442 RepID=A0AAQ3WQM6_PASNO
MYLLGFWCIMPPPGVVLLRPRRRLRRRGRPQPGRHRDHPNTLSHSDDVTGVWLRLRETTSIARGGRPHPRSACRRARPSARPRAPPWTPGPGGAPGARPGASALRGVALCLGGSRVLVYRPDEFGRCHRAHAGSRRRLLFTVACLGSAAAAEKLAEEWGPHVARPAELTALFARAYGEAMTVAADAEAGWVSMPDRVASHRLGRPALFGRTKARAMTEAEEGRKMQGRRASARRGLSLERMARAALGPGMRLDWSERPAARADWGNPELGEAERLQAIDPRRVPLLRGRRPLPAEARRPRRRLIEERQSGPVEITLTRAEPPNSRRWWRRDDDIVDDGDLGVLRIGRDLATVDTTFSTSDHVTKRWLAETAAMDRGHRLRAPLVAGLVALRGHDPVDRERYFGRGTDFKPSDRRNPIRCVALCLGGSRALVYSPEALGYRVRKPAYAGDLLKFYGNNMGHLRAFLEDKRIYVACFGAREATRMLAKEWGLHVAWPEELTELFALAYGTAAGVDAEKRPLTTLKKPATKHWTRGKAVLKRSRGKAKRDDDYDTDEEEEKFADPGTWRPPKVVGGLSLERMARVALGPEMRLARWPAKVAHADWGSYYLGEEEWAYATRDAYLCFEIAARCLQKLGDPIGS